MSNEKNLTMSDGFVLGSTSFVLMLVILVHAIFFTTNIENLKESNTQQQEQITTLQMKVDSLENKLDSIYTILKDK